MRFALVIAASALVAGCSGGAGDGAGPTSALTTPPTTRATPTTASTTVSSPPTSTPRPSASGPAPAPGTAIADVVAWIEAGPAADPGDYRSVTRDGASTTLVEGVAFTTPRADADCITNRYRGGALACLVTLADPPPRPPDFPSAWKNNWVDFDGAGVDVGSPHGDPGPFVDGSGAELPAGESLAFGDYRCRADDAAGLYCVNYAHQSAVRLSATGVEPFGCLHDATPPPDIGLRFAC